MSKIITIAGQKGGTGKSATAVNLAASLALFGKNTLLIDVDPRACSTQWCGLKTVAYNSDIASVLSGRARFSDAVVKTQVNSLDIMPAGFNLFQVALKLAKQPENEKILRLFLKEIDTEYEYIIIDSPSSYTFLSVTAMAAADWLIVCMTAHQNSVEDFRCLLRMVKYIRTAHKIPLKIAGLLFNRSGTKENVFSFLKDQQLSDIKQLVYATVIPEDDNIKKAIDLTLPIALHDIKSPAAEAYLSVAQELQSFFK